MSIGQRTGSAAPALALDPNLLDRHLREFSDLLGGPVVLYVTDPKGQSLWCSADVPATTFPAMAGLAAPSEEVLKIDQRVYNFPPIAPDTTPVGLRLSLEHPSPPGLDEVTHFLGPKIECLARQIAIDTNLTSNYTIDDEARKELDLITDINSYESILAIEDAVAELVTLSQSQLGCDGVVVALPSRRLLAVAPLRFNLDSQLNDIIARLSASLAKKKRVISARFTLKDGTDQGVLCSPILDNQRRVEGLVLILDQTPRGYSKIARTLSSKIASLQQSRRKLSRLLDRGQIVERIETLRAKEPEIPHSLIYFDADKVHTINDAFGYSAGDRALAKLSQMLCDSAGAMDSAGHITSDRFVLLMPGASVETALSKAGQILSYLSQQSIHDEHKSISLSASAGIASTASVTKSGEELVIIAEVAARGAKDRGGNQCVVYQDLDSSIIQRRSDVDKVGFLQMALIEDRFELHAQRIEAINTQASQKYELLIRLDDASESPGQFLSAAERYQMMGALDRWVINSALTSIASAENSLEVNLATFCINVSAQSLRDDHFIDHIEACIAETGVAPDTLCFEITETSLAKYIERAQRFIHRLQRLGCQVALDDFGTGYSSYAYLKNLPVNLLKIDGSFVRDIVDSRLSQAIVSSVVQVAEVLGALTVAEHVENDRVRDMLQDLGVHYVQGFSVHRPEPLQNILDGIDSASGVFNDDFEKIDLREYT